MKIGTSALLSPFEDVTVHSFEICTQTVCIICGVHQNVWICSLEGTVNVLAQVLHLCLVHK